MKLSIGRHWSKGRQAACAAAIATIALAAAAAVAVAQGEPATPAPKPLPGGAFKVAVVDLDEVFENSREWKDYQEKGRRLMDKLRRASEKYGSQLRILDNERANLPPGAERDRKMTEIEATAAEAKKTAAKLQDDIVAQRREALGVLFNKINGVIGTYAEEKGIDLMLKKQDLRVSPRQPAEMNVVLTTAHVLYARKRLDVTQDIARRLNAQYPTEVRDK